MRVIDKEFLLHISVFGSFNGIDFVLKLFYFNCFCFKDFQHLLQSSLQLLNIFGKITVVLVTVGMKIRALVAKLALAKPEVVVAGLGVPVLAALVAVGTRADNVGVELATFLPKLAVSRLVVLAKKLSLCFHFGHLI